MAKNFEVKGVVTLPLQSGQPPATANIDTAFVYTKKTNLDLVYAAPVTDEAISFGSLAVAGAKGLLVKCTAGACTLKINGPAITSNIPLPFQAGGYLLYANATEGFPTGCLITVTTTASLEIVAVA